MELDAVSEEQRVYARWLQWGRRIGLWLLIGAFALYAFGITEPHVPFDRLHSLWGLSADRFHAHTGAPIGWGWLHFLDTGDYLSLLPVALLSLVVLVCYLRVLPIQLRCGERWMAAITVAQALVLLAAASGVLAGGH